MMLRRLGELIKVIDYNNNAIRDQLISKFNVKIKINNE